MRRFPAQLCSEIRVLFNESERKRNVCAGCHDYCGITSSFRGIYALRRETNCQNIAKQWPKIRLKLQADCKHHYIIRCLDYQIKSKEPGVPKAICQHRFRASIVPRYMPAWGVKWLSAYAILNERICRWGASLGRANKREEYPNEQQRANTGLSEMEAGGHL